MRLLNLKLTVVAKYWKIAFENLRQTEMSRVTNADRG